MRYPRMCSLPHTWRDASLAVYITYIRIVLNMDVRSMCMNHVVMVCVCLFCICCNTSSNSQLSYINHHAFRYLRIYLDQMWFSQYRSRCRALFRLFSDCLLPKWPVDSLCCVDFPNSPDVYYLKIICWKTRGSQQNDVFLMVIQATNQKC